MTPRPPDGVSPHASATEAYMRSVFDPAAIRHAHAIGPVTRAILDTRDCSSWRLTQPRPKEILMDAMRHTLNLMESEDVDAVIREVRWAHEALDSLASSKLAEIESQARDARRRVEGSVMQTFENIGMSPGPDTEPRR